MNCYVIFGQFLLAVSYYAICQPMYPPKYELKSYELLDNEKTYKLGSPHNEHPYIAEVPNTTNFQVVIIDGETGKSYVFETFDTELATILYQIEKKVIIQYESTSKAGETSYQRSTFEFKDLFSSFEFMRDIWKNMDEWQPAFNFQMTLKRFDRQANEIKPVLYEEVSFYLYQVSRVYSICSFKAKTGGSAIPHPYLTFPTNRFVISHSTESNALIIDIDEETNSAYLIYFESEDNLSYFYQHIVVWSNTDDSLTIGEPVLRENRPR